MLCVLHIGIMFTLVCTKKHFKKDVIDIIPFWSALYSETTGKHCQAQYTK